MNRSLKILFVSAEVAPYAKTGGLADVAGSLPHELAEMGHDVRVVLPGYREIEAEAGYVTDFPVIIGERRETCIVKEIKDASCKTYTLNNHHYYNRDGIYCHPDDGVRFAFLCRASLDLMRAIGFKADILHLNDWHVGPAALLLKEHYMKTDSFYQDIKTVFTIHNLEYQGHFGKDMMDTLNLPEELFVPEAVEFFEMFNFMKAGIVYADKINTVSKTYADEILASGYGEGLEGVLKNRVKDLYGILNGISYEVFNPKRDRFIQTPFDEKNLIGKLENKKALQLEMGLPQISVPLIGVVHRLAAQKGLSIVIESFKDIMSLNVQFVLLGLGDPHLEEAFKKLMDKYPDQVSVRIEFNEELAHRIYAGSDIFLMPSVFEPCGLGQMISLRYGTIPIVRETGGLKDTIIDIGKDFKGGNGISFRELTAKSFLSALKRAVRIYSNEPGTWRELVRKGLTSDFSWKRSAKEYLALYQVALKG